MGKKILWATEEKDYEGNHIGCLLDPKKVQTGVYLADGNVRIWDSVPGNQEPNIPKKIIWNEEKYEKISEMDTDDAIAYLDSLVGAESRWAKEGFEPVANCLVYDMDNNYFNSLADCETGEFYEYLSNTNWKTISLGPNDTEYELEIIDTFNLDYLENNNTNFEFGGMGNHALLHKVLIDGKEKGLLWHEWSQWQGSELDTGFLLTADEALEKLVWRRFDGDEAKHPEYEEIEAWLKREE